VKKSILLKRIGAALGAALMVSACGGGKAEGGKALYRVDVYSQLANYAGQQVGWFGKVVKDKFNLELNIIPSGEGVYATRMSSGNLGDLVVFGNNGEEFTNAIAAGMLLDWNKNDLIGAHGPDIKKGMPQALQFNQDTFGGGTALYGFGHNAATNTSVVESYFYHPDIRFDIYQAIGSPEISGIEDYLLTLKKMVDYAPMGDSGLPAYAFSLFPDWDGAMVMSVKCIGAYYGYDEFGLGLYNAADNTFQPVLTEGGYYLQGLKFFNKAFQMGILDPDSATQTFSDVSTKYADGRVYWSMFSWLGPTNYNTQERTAQGKGMFAVAAKDQKNIVYGSPVYGGERIWTIGAKAKYPERIMELINWLCTPEGIMVSTYGPQGLAWDYDAGSKPYFTEFGLEVQSNPNAPVPAEAGGGIWSDGLNKINNTTFTADEINPVSGERYNSVFWSSELARDPSPAKKKWQDAMGALSEDEYLINNGHRTVVVASGFVKDVGRTMELEQRYTQVSTAIKDGSWRAIYAKNDAEFDRAVADMVSQAKGLGYDECIAWDTAEAAKRAAAVRRAMGR
jgi:multiple sugar transport system substrate-binding protein/putative aldouronate transport system substrate-binding protein